MMDKDQNMQSDYIDIMEDLKQTEQYQEQTDIKKQSESNKILLQREKNQIEREKIQAQREVADKQLQVARENKNQYDLKANKKNKSKE
jgi:hypothetical protein